MKKVLLLGFVCCTLLTSCGKDETPYTETVLYKETFDNWGNWERQPNSGGFYADSCVLVENGLLKMTRQAGINGCGGTWVGINIGDTSSYEPKFLDKIGFRIKLNKGSFNQVMRAHEGSSAAGSIELSSWMRLSYNRFFLSMPGGELTVIHADSALETMSNRIEGSEFELVYDDGQTTMFIDGLEASMDKVGFAGNSGVSQYLDIQFRVGHQSEFNPMISELFVDDIEIYTWCGKKQY